MKAAVLPVKNSAFSLKNGNLWVLVLPLEEWREAAAVFRALQGIVQAKKDNLRVFVSGVFETRTFSKQGLNGVENAKKRAFEARWDGVQPFKTHLGRGLGPLWRSVHAPLAQRSRTVGRVARGDCA